VAQTVFFIILFIIPLSVVMGTSSQQFVCVTPPLYTS
jgi:hypothetical protein